ncbi:hypothetical protein [Nonomuraea rubra]|uniref:hypothetical protein n=1 Tax=Nonomuraea rubra TaxID=46180 RepID=UPI0031E4EDAA
MAVTVRLWPTAVSSAPVGAVAASGIGVIPSTGGSESGEHHVAAGTRAQPVDLGGGLSRERDVGRAGRRSLGQLGLVRIGGQAARGAERPARCDQRRGALAAGGGQLADGRVLASARRGAGAGTELQQHGRRRVRVGAQAHLGAAVRIHVDGELFAVVAAQPRGHLVTGALPLAVAADLEHARDLEVQHAGGGGHLEADPADPVGADGLVGGPDLQQAEVTLCRRGAVGQQDVAVAGDQPDVLSRQDLRRTGVRVDAVVHQRRRRDRGRAGRRRPDGYG